MGKYAGAVLLASAPGWWADYSRRQRSPSSPPVVFCSFRHLCSVQTACGPPPLDLLWRYLTTKKTTSIEHELVRLIPHSTHPTHQFYLFKGNRTRKQKQEIYSGSQLWFSAAAGVKSIQIRHRFVCLLKQVHTVPRHPTLSNVILW